MFNALLFYTCETSEGCVVHMFIYVCFCFLRLFLFSVGVCLGVLRVSGSIVCTLVALWVLAVVGKHECLDEILSKA